MNKGQQLLDKCQKIVERWKLGLIDIDLERVSTDSKSIWRLIR